MRYLIKMAYDGSEFIGWQKQKQGRSIQCVMEKALEQFSGVSVPVIAAGRTDAGVHALAQYAHFDYEGRMTMEQMLRAFRRWLPDDIKVLQIWQIGNDLSARYQAFERHYKYLLSKDRDPFNRLYSGFIPHLRISLKPMQDAAQLLLGQHDFSSFGRLNPEVPNHICEIKEISIVEDEDYFTFYIRADRFLHNMVRRIVGTLANISHFALSPDTITKLLADKCPRQNLVTTAPAEGLYLIDVKYPSELLDGRGTCRFDDLIKRKP
ncbi:MAG: tRNA pseudouridine(38-40) synthase TruA [Candidatus Cloacimonadales bacterium]|jgi:tRNA pseudouridine38-40 synthase|nr:tRNA pseudouridine(38-40) synthase TruA [Candidatus Cloacimonadota bacterium]MDY0380768.1 tRNA pseudouridine(38-40) synthase TruA [Candidatus Cloacimonadaceae bacterium]MCB5256373.1 tRNA pseudouridine(38-40) synthase TruA [Candidatus Cloacimonadota bacterium]MCB5263367.1 tRNA pseudouridine(38-40) synthase TruA [Candidatus Cloacimonadota bacterium]MCB5276808.1 tRNA pseudouridine(38-40) synthase TruA [Candidatus Cloacimonadota bacterium]